MIIPGYEDREISPAKRDVPEGVFCFSQVDTWRDRVWAMLADLVSDDVRALFKMEPPKYVVSDDLEWLDDLIFRTTGQETDIKAETAARLRLHYRAFRAAHATRTADLGQFYERGLRYLRPEEIEDRARSILMNGQAVGASEDALQTAIKEIDARNLSGGRTGKLYFCAVEENLYSEAGHAGHYLTYGSEYLYCLAIRAAPWTTARRTLKEIGRPTLFVCDIPLKLIRESTLKEFSGMMLEYLFCELVEELEAHSLGPGAGSAFMIQSDLPAECIVGHYHPAKIHDPLRYW